MRTLLRLIQKYADLLLFLLLEAIAVFLMARGSIYQHSRISNFNRQISGYVYSRFDGAREYFSLKEVNQKLHEENTRLRNQLDQLHVKLDTALVLREHRDGRLYSYIPSRVVQNNVFKQYNYLTLDRGKKHGVFRNMGVISDQGLVGIVQESSESFSTVIPIINRDFRLSAKIRSNNYAGILSWDGGSPLQAALNEIPFHVELQEGDTIVSSGFSSIFPEGIAVGTIASFSLEQGNFYDISIQLFTDFQQLYHVKVIRNFRQEEQLNLENRTR